MSSIQNIDVSLQAIVKNIDKNIYLIPKFQRDFVWKRKAIEELGDSIIRGYPISSLLIMPENGNLKVSAHSLIENIKKEYNQEENNEPKYYILDGQQRLTSIAKLFLPKNNGDDEFYFDLLALLLDKFPEDKILEIPSVKKLTELSGVITDNYMELCRAFSVGKGKGKQLTRHYNRFISGESVIEKRYSEVIDDFFEQWFDGFKSKNKTKFFDYKNYVTSVLGVIGEYKIPAMKIDGESELGIVIRVFEKVNTTGKKLTLFDLINAQSFEDKKHKDGLSDYLSSEIKSTSHERHGVFNFLEYKDNGKFENLARIIRIFEIANLLEKNTIPAISKQSMLARGSSFWFGCWEKQGNKFLEIVEWMNEEGLLDIGQVTFLEYAIAILLAKPTMFENLEYRERIEKYAIYLTLSESSFTKSNLDVVKKLYTSESPNMPININDKMILDCKPTSSQTKVIQKILQKKGVTYEINNEVHAQEASEIINSYFSA
ncbi:uncharacterized protein DUF262 [Azomonas agilis]|uniref:Uncharacterized protein DUF262 n=1 Tax=Azomonas agilis TaxID=116849 RepID=A0A562J0F1_9GAMM|nr:DUF262 domain-containing protein [Azomonas agilis]TWH76771.1 uncharacterized protein DUF262 [Azomonas agilis]